MTTHEFTLMVEGPDLQDEVRLSALFEAGCDDATVGRVGSVQYLDFEREAPAADVALARSGGVVREDAR